MRQVTNGPALREAGVIGVCCLAFVLGGCVSREKVLDEIYHNRRAAYEAWKRAKTDRDGGQTLVKGDLTVPSSVLIALGNNKALKAVYEEKNRARGGVVEAYSEALPKVDLDSSYRRRDKVGALFPGQKGNWNVDLVLTQPIFKGGAIWAGIRGAQLLAYAADEQVDATVQDVVYNTRRQYYDVLLARELTSVSEGDLELANVHLEDVRKKKAAGVVSQYDVLRARVEVSNVEAELIERQNDFHLAMTTLLKTMGVSQESKVRLTDRLDYAPIAYELDTAVEAAFHERPEILRAELTVRQNREIVREAWAGFLPRIDGVLTETYARPDPHNPAKNHWGDSWEAAVVLSWPIFDGLASVGRVRQAKADLRRAAIELAEAEEQVLLDVKQALFNLEDADKFVQSQADNLERATEGLRLAKAGYDAGVNTELEMLDARQALSETQARYYEAVHRHETAKIDLDRATGQLKRHRPQSSD